MTGAPVTMWDIPGQERAADVLRRAAARGEAGHAWAFMGPSGVGQEQGARALAAALNCPRPDAPCGVCDVCRRCARGVHPAYMQFVPSGVAHRVGDVRDQWLHAAAHSALEGRWKVLHVVAADRMNEAAANAFLKGLEEPPPATTWVLEVADPDDLPDTILSRCREVRFVPWARDVLEAHAAELGLSDADERAVAVRAALGTPAVLRRLAAPGGMEDLRAHRAIPCGLRSQGPGFALTAARALDDEVKRHSATIKAEGKRELDELGELYGGQAPRHLTKQLSERVASRERDVRTSVVQAALDDIVGWYRDCLVVVADGDADATLDPREADTLRAEAAALGPDRLLEAADLVLAARDSLELNVQQGLALEALFMRLAALSLPRR